MKVQLLERKLHLEKKKYGQEKGNCKSCKATQVIVCTSSAPNWVGRLVSLVCQNVGQNGSESKKLKTICYLNGLFKISIVLFFDIVW